MLARRLPGILPSPTFEDAVETTTIHSVAGLVPENAGLVTRRPFRSPHHTVSEVALIGGGREPRPGEASLAHHGVLFLDEMPEFGRRVLDLLRQPLEDGVVRVSRAAGTVAFPARFLLVGAMNPCPCGFAGDPVRECRCTPGQVERYGGRLSGPLLDRFDLVIPVRGLDATELQGASVAEPSRAVQARVIRARQRQTERRASTRASVNAELASRVLHDVCGLDDAGQRMLERACRALHLSARAYHRLCRVARTVADLDASDRVRVEHLAEAISFRTRERPL